MISPLVTSLTLYNPTLSHPSKPSTLHSDEHRLKELDEKIFQDAQRKDPPPFEKQMGTVREAQQLRQSLRTVGQS